MTAQLFDSIHRSDALGFFSDHHTNYKAVSNFLELDKSSLSKISGVSKSSVRLDDRIPAELKSRLDEIADICNQVADYFDGDVKKTTLWFRVPNPLLGNISPRDMIRYGRYKKLRKFIQEARLANAS